ncbi:MAG: type I restriction endonuclease subunit R [Acidobacteriaceae bacterium]
MSRFTESVVEDAALEWLEALGYTILHGPEIAAGEPAAERDDSGYRDVILERRLRQALERLNPAMPPEAIADAYRRLTLADELSTVRRNHALHQRLVEGVNVEYTRQDGSIGGALVQVIDFEHPENNDWAAVNQFTVVEGQNTRRPDVLIFVNGLPLVLMELKNPADENATIWKAFDQIQTYKDQIPALFTCNEILIISDGLDARVGSLTADRERFMPWRTIEGEDLAPASLPQLQVVLQGLLDKRRLLDYLRYFIVFEEEREGVLVKKIAGYHQFHAVNKALAATLAASHEEGDRRVGVVWHTQGSGKSLTMAFYAGRLVLEPALQNPTIVMLTDRNDLDDQLFGTFSRCHELLRQAPIQAEDREHLRMLLQVSSGGVVFTTIQKFLPEPGERYPQLSDRRNIIVMADEAHRSQYDFIDGFARHMRDALPHASYIGFTGTPIEKSDANTRAVFGDYISVYDIQRAVEDHATVPIYYEGRLAKLQLDESEKPKLDQGFEEVTEGEEVDRKERLRTKWAAVEALVGTEKRLKLVADDLVRHFEERLEAMDGKAMIVCMSRRICVDLYDQIVKLRPSWHSENDDAGMLKVVMTGSAADGPEWQKHIRDKKRREALAKRFKVAGDPFKIVIVRDMWLTGFDAPCLHTMYVDKPMRGHGLMQAIARVNRVFRDKPGGLVVDYLGIAQELKQALATYTESGGLGRTAIPQEEAVATMLEKYEICRGLFHGFNWAAWTTGSPAAKLAMLPNAQEHILALKDGDGRPSGKERLNQAVTELSIAFALAVPHEEALRIRDDVGFFQAVRNVLNKSVAQQARPEYEMDAAIRQLVSRAVMTDGVVDIFSAAGLKKPDISILSDEFLAEVSHLPQKNLAVELLRKLLNNEIRTGSRRNLVKARLFSDLLETSLRKYQNRAIQAAQVIEELVGLARQMREEAAKGAELGLTEDEVAFYDALEVNDSAVKVLGEPTLKNIARELVDTVRRNTTIDWTVRENVRAHLRVLVKRILRKYGYPPDKQEKATFTVLEQAELLSAAWA